MFEDQSQIVRSQLKGSSSERQPQKRCLSQNDSKWLDQPQSRVRCVNVSLREALRWSECKVSVEQILHFDLPLWERIPFNDQPSSSTSGSDTALTTKSRYSSFWGRERSLDRGSKRRALQHSAKNSILPLGLRWLSAKGFEARLGKATSTLRFHTASPVKDRLRKPNFSAR